MLSSYLWPVDGVSLETGSAVDDFQLHWRKSGSLGSTQHGAELNISLSAAPPAPCVQRRPLLAALPGAGLFSWPGQPEHRALCSLWQLPGEPPPAGRWPLCAFGRPCAVESLGPAGVSEPGAQPPAAALAPALELQPAIMGRTEIKLKRLSGY